MEIAELIAQLEGHGATLTIDGDRVRVRAPAAPPAEVLERLRREKQALICYLKARRVPCLPPANAHWPEGSQDAARRFAQSHAKLFPFIGRKMRTPDGAGTLLQVFAERATVLLDSERDKCRVFAPEDMEPVSAEMG